MISQQGRLFFLLIIYLSSSIAMAHQDEDVLIQKMNVLTVNTNDQKTCSKISTQLYNDRYISESQYQSFCLYDKEKPLVSIYLEAPAERGIGIRFSDLSPREQELARQTRNYSLLAIGMMGLLYAMPKDITGWEGFNASELKDNYIKNVKSGPVVDHNEWWVNWIGHPVSGASYYVVARHAGFSQGESFLYSAMMSTFYWEYGFEAVSQVPSIQDLIFTPLLGSLLGEFMFQQSEKIKKNNGKVLNSKALGSLALAVTDPAGFFLDMADRVFPENRFVDSRGYMYTDKSPNYGDMRLNVGIEFIF